MDPSWDPYHEKRITLGGLVDHYRTIKRGRRVMFVACGTSYHACLACRQTMEELAELPVRLEARLFQNLASMQQFRLQQPLSTHYCLVFM